MKDLVAHLNIAQPDGYPDGRNVGKRTTEHHLRAHIRYPTDSVWIENDNIAHAEVRHIRIHIAVEKQHYTLHGIAVMHQPIDCHSVVDIARGLLLLQRVEPFGREPRILLCLIANLRQQMLHRNEAQEAQIIGLLQRRGIAHWLQKFFYLRTNIFIPQFARYSFFIQVIGREHRQYPHPIIGKVDFLPCNLVT